MYHEAACVGDICMVMVSIFFHAIVTAACFSAIIRRCRSVGSSSMWSTARGGYRGEKQEEVLSGRLVLLCAVMCKDEVVCIHCSLEKMYIHACT